MSTPTLATYIEVDGRARKTSAIEACQMIREWKPEMLVSDIGMPGEDGYDLMRKIRALTPEGGGTIPAVALTGYAGAVDESKAYAAGYQVHMTKPVALRELAATVAKLAGRSKDLTHTAASKSTPKTILPLDVKHLNQSN